MKVKCDRRSKFSNLSNWKEEAWKNQGFNGIRTRDLRDTGAMLYQLSYEANMWLPMCGFIAQLVEHRTGIAEVTGSNPVEALIFSGFFFPIAQIGKFTATITFHFLIRTLAHRCLRICSSSFLFQWALSDLKKTLLQNGYPRGVLCFHLNHVLNRQKNKSADPIATVPRKDIFLVLPFLGSQSEVLC